MLSLAAVIHHFLIRFLNKRLFYVQLLYYLSMHIFAFHYYPALANIQFLIICPFIAL